MVTLRNLILSFALLFFVAVVAHGQVGDCRAYMLKRYGGELNARNIGCTPDVEAAEVALKNTLDATSCKTNALNDLLNDANKTSILVETDAKEIKKWNRELATTVFSSEVAITKHLVLVQQYLVVLKQMSLATQDLIKDPPKEFCLSMKQEEIAEVISQRKNLDGLLAKHRNSLEMVMKAIGQKHPVQVMGLSEVISAKSAGE